MNWGPVIFFPFVIENDYPKANYIGNTRKYFMLVSLLISKSLRGCKTLWWRRWYGSFYLLIYFGCLNLPRFPQVFKQQPPSQHPNSRSSAHSFPQFSVWHLFVVFNFSILDILVALFLSLSFSFIKVLSLTFKGVWISLIIFHFTGILPIIWSPPCQWVLSPMARKWSTCLFRCELAFFLSDLNVNGHVFALPWSLWYCHFYRLASHFILQGSISKCYHIHCGGYLSTLENAWISVRSARMWYFVLTNCFIFIQLNLP